MSKCAAAGAAPLTPDEEDALATLDALITGYWDVGSKSMAETLTKRARTLKAMLAEPRLPAEFDHVALNAIRDRMHEQGWSLSNDAIRCVLSIAYSHLIVPKTKKIWHIVFCDHGSCRKDGYVSQEAALRDAGHFLKLGHVISVEELEIPA